MNAAAYARYSTEHQTSSSIEYQMKKIQDYCLKNNINITKCYADEAYSGTNLDRPAFKALCEDAKYHKFDAVIIYDISRGSRDVSDWFSFRKQMAILGVQVISVEDKIGDILNPSDYLTELITVGLGQHHVLTSRQKSMDSIALKAKTGQFLGGTPNLGYDIVNKQYVINKAEAKIVKKIFNMYADGASYVDIMNAIGTVYGKRGKAIGKNSLHYILKNERYIGTYTWCKRHTKIMGKWAGGTPNPNAVRIEDAIPPIIDKNTWERVQMRMQDKKHRASNKAKREYLLSGLIECTECGAKFVGHTSTKRGHENRYYCCGNKYRNRTCTAKNINADEVESFVIDSLKSYLKDIDYKSMAKTIADKVNGASADLKEERKELDDIIMQLNNGTKAILKGIDYPELQDEMLKLRVRKSELEDIIAKKSDKNVVKPEKVEALFINMIDNLDTDLKNICKQMIKIYAHADGSLDLNIGVHITGCGSQI
ncbi:MAG: recombinase family protein [Ruminococcus sp.]|nr:recombinase family protein [Ruminococcus sp.]